MVKGFEKLMHILLLILKSEFMKIADENVVISLFPFEGTSLIIYMDTKVCARMYTDKRN